MDAKAIPQLEEESQSLFPKGIFTQNNLDSPLAQYIDTLYDPQSDETIRIQYMCACGDSVYQVNNPDFGFACVHCDSICTDDLCDNCFDLMSVDFGDPNAKI